MTAALIAETSQLLRHFLQRHDRQGYRPVPLAQAIGEKDVRRVRAALREMASAGELVTCNVHVPGSGETDIEVRLVAGGRAPPAAPPLVNTAGDAWLRRSDSSHVPSHFGRGEAIAPSKPVAHPEAAPTLDSIPKFVAKPAAKRPAAAAPSSSMSEVPTQNAPATAATAIAEPARADNHTGLWKGAAPTRQIATLEYMVKVDRAVSVSELYDQFEITPPAIHSAVRRLAAKGCIVYLGRLPEPRRGGLRVMTYATPAVAARLQANTQGSGGEVAPTVQPVAEAAPPADATPREEELPAQKTGQDAPGAPECGAYKNLASYFIRCEGNWYGLAWLVRMADADVPDTLEALARLMREGKLGYSTADRAPIWHPIESVESVA